MASQKEHSVSRFNIFRGCPFAYKKIVLEKVAQAIPQEAMIDGRLLHEMVAAYLIHLLATAQRLDLEWAQGNIPPEASFRVRQTWKKWSVGFVIPAAIERPMVEARIALNRNFEFCQDFFKSPGLFFRLVIDFAFVQDGLGIVRDWKSNLITFEDPLEDEQMVIYGHFFQKLTGVEEILLSVESLALGYRRESCAHPQDLAHVPDMIREMAARIETNQKWEPTPGSYCGRCGVPHFCPEMEQALIDREYLAPATAADAEKLASLLIRLDVLREFLSDKLKGWVSEYGPIEAGDMIYGPVPTSSPILDPEEITELLLAEGIPRQKVWEAVSLTKTNLTRILRSREIRRRDLLDKIIMNAPAKESAMIKFHKPGGEVNGG